MSVVTGTVSCATHRISWARQALLVQKVILVQSVPPGHRARLVHKGLKVEADHRVVRVQLARRAQLAHKVPQEPLAALVRRALRDFKEQSAQQVESVRKAPREPLAGQVPRVPLARREPQARWDSRGTPAQLAAWAVRAIAGRWRHALAQALTATRQH